MPRGSQAFNLGEIFRYQQAIGAEDIHVYTYLEAHGDTCLDTKSVEIQIDSEPIAGMLVGGPRTGSPPEQVHFKKIKESFPDKPLILGSGLNKGNIADLLPYADGVIVGTTIKEDAFLHNPINFDKAKALIEAAGKVNK